MNDIQCFKWLESHGYATQFDGIPCCTEAGLILWGRLNPDQQKRVCHPELRKCDVVMDEDILSELKARSKVLKRRYYTDDIWLILYNEAVQAE